MSLHLTPYRLRTPSAVAQFWKMTDRRRLAWNRVVRQRIGQRFAAEAKAVVAGYLNARLDGVERAVKRQRGAWWQLYRTVYLGVGRDFAGSTLRDLRTRGRKADEDEGLNPVEQRIHQYLQATAGRKITGIEEATLRRVRATLAEAFAEGLPTAAITRELEQLYSGWESWRAESIARTEVLGAANLGAHEAAKETGLDLVKVWIATKDDRTRDTHREADGEMAEMDDPFRIESADGGEDELLFPGDSSRGASAGNIINCRCAVGYQPRTRG